MAEVHGNRTHPAHEPRLSIGFKSAFTSIRLLVPVLKLMGALEGHDFTCTDDRNLTGLGVSPHSLSFLPDGPLAKS